MAGWFNKMAMYGAVISDEIPAVTRMLQEGIDINLVLKKKTQARAIHAAVGEGLTGMTSFLAESGADLNAKAACATALHIAASKGYHAVAEILLTNGASVDMTNQVGMTPLHMAVVENHPNAVEVLLAHGADINYRDGYHGCTPLDLADASKNCKVADILRSHGAASGFAKE